MGREYYYKPPEWTKERMRDIFTAFNDDIPISEFAINRFFIDHLENYQSSGIVVVNRKVDEMIPNMAQVYDAKSGTYTLEKRMTPASEYYQQNDEVHEEYANDVDVEIINMLLEDIHLPGVFVDFVVIGGGGETLVVDEDTLIALPKILMRIIEHGYS